MSDKGTLNRLNNKRKVEILRFFIKFLQKVLVIREKVVPLQSQIEICSCDVRLHLSKKQFLHSVCADFAPVIGVWCNGNTTDSGPVILGSSPSTPTRKRKASIWKPFLFLLFLILSVDSLDLLTYEVHVVFQLLNLAVHLVNETVAFL